MLKNTKRKIVLMTTCVLTGMTATGCTLSGRNLFMLKKKEPSAEVLAGSGPTSTFPAPPSSTATPEAIASIAGGTAAPATANATSSPSPISQPAQYAGLNASPGYTTSPSPPNLAAAQANGIYGNTATKSVGFRTPAAPAPQPSGYTFGNKALTPKAEESATEFAISDLPATGNAESATAASGFTVPSTNFAPPAMGGYPTAQPSPPAIPQRGLTFPTDGPAVAEITPPTSDISGFGNPSDATAAGDILPPAATSPAFSTASTAVESATPSATLAPASVDHNGGFGGYTPGSTGSATGYPSGAEVPATQGSIYR